MKKRIFCLFACVMLLLGAAMLPASASEEEMDALSQFYLSSRIVQIDDALYCVDENRICRMTPEGDDAEIIYTGDEEISDLQAHAGKLYFRGEAGLYALEPGGEAELIAEDENIDSRERSFVFVGDTLYYHAYYGFLYAYDTQSGEQTMIMGEDFQFEHGYDFIGVVDGVLYMSTDDEYSEPYYYYDTTAGGEAEAYTGEAIPLYRDGEALYALGLDDWGLYRYEGDLQGEGTLIMEEYQPYGMFLCDGYAYISEIDYENDRTALQRWALTGGDFEIVHEAEGYADYQPLNGRFWIFLRGDEGWRLSGSADRSALAPIQ